MNDVGFVRSNRLQVRLHELVPTGARTVTDGSDQYPEGMTPVLFQVRPVVLAHRSYAAPRRPVP